MMCGFTVSGYIRTRRLALAGSEFLAGNERIIDIALEIRLRFTRQLYKGVHEVSRCDTRLRAKRSRDA